MFRKKYKPKHKDKNRDRFWFIADIVDFFVSVLDLFNIFK